MSCYVILKSANLFFKISPRVTKFLAGNEQAYAQRLREDFDLDL